MRKRAPVSSQDAQSNGKICGYPMGVPKQTVLLIVLLPSSSLIYLVPILTAEVTDTDSNSSIHGNTPT